MRKEKLLERGDGDNSDDESGTEGVKQMDFLNVEFSRSREFWIKVKMQRNLNNAKFSVIRQLDLLFILKA